MSDDIDIGALSEALNYKADNDLGNLMDDGENIANWSSNMTNCITKIPQDIKVELNNDGSLTLKAGSIVYIPDGFEQDGVTKKFNKVVITNDITHQAWTGNNKSMLFVKPSTNQKTVRTLDAIFSGTSVSTSYLNMCWYDTTNNKIKMTDDSGSTWNEEWTFPLCIVSADNMKFTSIDSVFNGFGFIGSVLFALPDVTGLLPNGRNEDGTLNNIKYTIDKVRLREFSWNISGSGQYIALYSSGEILGSSATNRPFYQQEETPSTGAYSYWYKPSENFTYATFESDTSWTKFPLAIIGKVVGDATGKISSLTIKTTMKLIDANDIHSAESIIDGMMPDYTKGVSMTSPYTAPNTGWVLWRGDVGQGPVYLTINNIQVSSVGALGQNDTNTYTITLPVSKSDIIGFDYGGCAFYPCKGVQ